MKLDVEITRYRVVDDKVEATTTTEPFEVDIDGEWLRFRSGPQSALTTRLVERALEGEDWGAQAGTEPVYSPPCPHPDRSHECCGRTCELPRGGWGGRNYPRMIVTAETLKSFFAWSVIAELRHPNGELIEFTPEQRALFDRCIGAQT